MENYFSIISMFNILEKTSENFLLIISYIILSYLIGSIPFGIIFGKIFKIGDIRKIGSGNIGATNVLRSGNKIAAFLTLFFDGFKGALIIQLSILFVDPSLSLLFGFVCFLGHLYPIFLFFRGGKGVATFFGILLSYDFLFGFFICFSWIVILILFRISSVSALLSSFLSTILSIYFFEKNNFFIIILFCSFIWIKHLTNILRIIKGKEPKIKFKI